MIRRNAVVAVAVVAALIVPASPAVADGIRDSQWHLAFLDVAAAHRTSLGVGVTVAVVDSGVDATHPDLTDNVLPGIDPSGRTDGPERSDVDGRGTGLAGLVAGHGHGVGRPAGNGADGVLGVAPRARVLPVAITTRPGQFGDPDVLADGIDAAVARGATVICVGRGLPASPRLEQAVAAAIRAGAVVVAPTVNRRGEQFLPWPASYPGVLAVAPVDRAGSLAVPPVTATPVPSGSPTPSSGGVAPGTPTIAAPGVDLVTADSGGGYRIDAGSAATAVVAGAVALVRARFPILDPSDVVRRIAATARDQSPAPGYGSGVLDVVRALTSELPARRVGPSVAPSRAVALPAPPTASSEPPTAVAEPGRAAFDTTDVGRWLVAVPLVAFMIGLVLYAVRGRREESGTKRRVPAR